MGRSRVVFTSNLTRPFYAGFLLSCLLISSLQAQRPSSPDPTTTPGNLTETLSSYLTRPGTGVLVLSVFAERTTSRLDRQALLTLVNLADHSAVWTTTEDNAKGVLADIPYGRYDLEVSAVGYLSSHKEVVVNDSMRPLETEVVLHRDPTAINLDVTDSVMSPKARKETKHAITLLKSNKLDAAQKQLDAAYKLSPSSPDLNFLLGYLYFQRKQYGQAGNYLATAANLSPHNAQALTLLGRNGLERRDYPAARSALEQAVLADADNWLPHDLLADTYLHQQNYSQARDEAQIAITKGKNLASPAQIVLGEAMVGLGRNEEGIRALNAFLQQSPTDPLAEPVRSLIAELNKPVASHNVSQSPTTSPAHMTAIDPLAAVAAPTLAVKAWEPPGVDDIKPVTAPSVSCPTDHVIDEAGKRTEELVADVERFAAIEDLFHQSLDAYGIPVRTETRKYNYVASITEPEPGTLSVNEYREEKLTTEGYPDHIASLGFAAMALVFHPHMRDSFEMVCEGLGDWRGQASWLIHFRQRDDRPNRMQSYRIGNNDYPVALKGRAWITADKFQIVRVEAELVHPVAEIQLLSEHQIVEYGPVPFPKKNTALWLPKNVEIYLDFRKHRYYRRHSFDHYMLYSVDTEEKRKEPGAKPADPAGKKSPA